MIGLILRKIAVARFCRTLSTLISSGVPILDGLDITAKTAGNSVIEDAILSTRKSIERGETISAPLKETGVFPPMVSQMIGVGEATGALDTMLAKIADFYEEEVDTAVAGLLTLLEPLMIALLGGIVGGIVIAMYMPIFDLISKLTWPAGRAGHAWPRDPLRKYAHRADRAAPGHQHGAAGVGRRGAVARGAATRRPWPLYALIGLTFVLSVLYATVLQPSERRRWPLDVQLAADALTVAAFVWFTGGVTSYFSSLFVLPIIAASILLHRRGAVLVAVLGVAALRAAGRGAVRAAGPAPAGGRGRPCRRAARAAGGVLHGRHQRRRVPRRGGVLSGSLAERVRRTNQELAEASTEIASLQAFSQHIIDSLTMGLVTTEIDRAHPHVQPRRRGDYRAGGRTTVVGALAAEVLQLPAEFAAPPRRRARACPATAAPTTGSGGRTDARSTWASAPRRF